MHLAALQPQDIIVVVIFVVLPLAQKLFQHLQKKRAEVEAKESMRHRREGTLPSSSSTASSTTDEPRSRGGLLERLEEMVGEAQSQPAAEERTTRVPDFETETFWGDLAPETESVPEPPAAPRRVAPAIEVRRPVAQISDFESTSREGLGAMSAAPREADIEAGGFDYGVLAQIEGLDDSLGLDSDPLEPLVDLSELTSLPTTSGGRPARAGRGRRGGRAVGLTGEQNWRRAIVLAEVLGPPVSMRDPGGFAPGLAPWVS